MKDEIDPTVKLVLGWGVRIIIALIMAVVTILSAVMAHYVKSIENLQEAAQVNNVQHAEMYAMLKKHPPKHVTILKSMPEDSEGPVK
jgi:flagellar basal body-associated protein FliL